MQSLIRFVFLVIVGTVCLTTNSLAELRVCNDVNSAVGISIGYKKDGVWTTQGWWEIQPNSCQLIIDEPLTNRFYYLYAETQNKGLSWEGSIPMCIQDDVFTIEGMNDCFARGLQRVGFQEYDTLHQSSWTIRINNIVNH